MPHIGFCYIWSLSIGETIVSLNGFHIYIYISTYVYYRYYQADSSVTPYDFFRYFYCYFFLFSPYSVFLCPIWSYPIFPIFPSDHLLHTIPHSSVIPTLHSFNGSFHHPGFHSQVVNSHLKIKNQESGMRQNT